MTGMKERADLGFANTLDDFDPSEWMPQERAANARPRRAETRKVAESAGFRSREPKPVTTEREIRLAEAEADASGIAQPSAREIAHTAGASELRSPIAAEARSSGVVAAEPAPQADAARVRAAVRPTAGPAAARAQAAPPSAPSSHPPRPDMTMQAGTTPYHAPVRGRRTGRNAQFSVKTRPETIAALYAIADGHGWGVGETFERAVALLAREHGQAGRAGEPDTSAPHDGGARCS